MPLTLLPARQEASQDLPSNQKECWFEHPLKPEGSIPNTDLGKGSLEGCTHLRVMLAFVGFVPKVLNL